MGVPPKSDTRVSKMKKPHPGGCGCAASNGWSECVLDGHDISRGFVRPVWHDAEEVRGLGRAFQIQVMFANDRFGVARLQRRFPDRAEFCHEHRNKRVAHHVVRKTELLAIRARIFCRFGTMIGNSSNG